MKAIRTTNQGGNTKLGLRTNHYIKYTHNVNKFGLLSAFLFTLLALTSLFPISKGEQNTEAVTGTAQSSSLTLNVASQTASVVLDVNSMAGTFATSSADDSAAFSVVTNNFSGYTLSISGSDNEGKLYDITKSYFLEPLTSAVSEADFSSTSSLNGKWGYKPSKFNSLANSNYLPAPTTFSSTLDKTSAANATANDYTISLGLRADYSTAANTYTNAFVITAVPNPIAYVITYDANTTDTVSNMPAAQNSTTSATEITLTNNIPSREGYNFKGWCSIAPTEARPNVCAGIAYQPGNAYDIDQTTENITTLYAMWAKPSLQEYSYMECASKAVDNPVILTDIRNNKDYTVRYINGNCWMTQNLKIDKGQEMTPEDTNITSNFTMPTNDLSSGVSSTVPKVHEDADTGNWYNFCAATAGEICNSSAASNDDAAQDICPAGWRLPTAYEQRDSLTNGKWQSYVSDYPLAFNPTPAGIFNSAGNFVTAGTGGVWWSSTLNKDNSYRISYEEGNGLYSGNASSRASGFSVRCIKRKPSVIIEVSFNPNGGAGRMQEQYVGIGEGVKLTANAFTNEGYDFIEWNTEPDGAGTAYKDQATFLGEIDTSDPTVRITLYAQWGKLPIMQEYGFKQCKENAESQAVTLKDARDNKAYTVRYINGGCWMTQNLKIDAGQPMTPDDTNISAGYSISPSDMYVGDSVEIGNYYNNRAATAGTNGGRYDICPMGWHLPDRPEYETLASDSSSSSETSPYVALFTPVTAGYYDGGNNLYDLGNYGYWRMSSGSTIRYHAMNASLSTSNGGSNSNKYSVRCVKRPYISIIFNANGGNGAAYSQRIGAGINTYLTANEFAMPNHVFAGWNTKPDGTGTAYADRAAYTAPMSDENNTITLYAQWKIITINELVHASSMQTLTTSQCANSDNGAVAELVDVRNYKSYTIAKIDGKCWMTQNLKIDKGQAMSPADTNIASNYIMTSIDLTTGDNSYTQAEIHEGDNTSGNWYNYCAATAGTICDNTNSTNASQDICPAGWRLPTQSDFYSLTSGYGKRAAFNIVFAGYYGSGSLRSSGSSGYHWSSTASNTARHYILSSYDSFSWTSYSSDFRYYGNSVRCVLK